MPEEVMWVEVYIPGSLFSPGRTEELRHLVHKEPVLKLRTGIDPSYAVVLTSDGLVGEIAMFHLSREKPQWPR